MTIRIEERLAQFDRLTVLVAGDFMIDQYLSGTSTRISPEAPVPVVHIKKTFFRLGGAGNVVRNLAALGAKLRVVLEVGDDANGAMLIGELAQLGADLTYARQTPQVCTSVKTRVLAQNQQLLRFDEEDIRPVSSEWVEALRLQADSLFSGIDMVLLSDYGKGALTSEMTAFLINEATSRGIGVTVDPKGTDYSKYAGATVCTPNLKELIEAVGTDRLETEDAIYQAAETLCRQNNIEYMLTTRSEKGMSLQRKGAAQKQDFPVVSKEVIDVTGAGDTVIAAFTLCYGAGFPLELCCKLANVAASIVVSKTGAATATREEICAVLEDMGHERCKIRTADALRTVVKQLHEAGRRVVFTNGCFDLVHAGHISSFRQAKAFGDVLIVGVNSDDSIRRIKGPRRPIVGQQARLALLEALDMVDYLVLFDEDTPQTLIEQLCPDVMVKGKDWEGKSVAGGEFVCAHGGRVEFIELEQGLSTTQIIEQVLRAYGEST